MKGVYLRLKFIYLLYQNLIFLLGNLSPSYFISFISIMFLFFRIQKIFIKILTEIKKNCRRLNKSLLEKSIFNLRLIPGSAFVKYFNPTTLYLELGEHERKLYQKPYFIFIFTLESLVSYVYKLYCESDVYDFVSDLFANNDDQKMITSILILLQDITHFNNLASIRKFTEIVGSLNGGPLYILILK